MPRFYRGLVSWLLFSVGGVSAAAAPQNQVSGPQLSGQARMNAEASRTAELLGLDATLAQLRDLQSGRSCETAPDLREVLLKQDLLETELMAVIDVDSVLSEISAERADLMDTQASLKNRRDRTTGLLNAASLITGSGVGIAVNATQLRDSTAAAGDYLGVGSGIASTSLALLAIRKMKGPQGSVGTIPNMLAPLFDRKAELNSFYPTVVMSYLEEIPPNEAADRGTRLDQMRAGWIAQQRIEPGDTEKGRAKITALTSSASPTVKLSISDISDRVAMLNDVSARIAFLKRDLATLLHSYRIRSASCKP